jgi:hypothetical protein
MDSPLIRQRLSYDCSDLSRLKICQILRVFAVYRACAIDENAIRATGNCKRRPLTIIFGPLQDIIACVSKSIHILIGRQVVPVRHHDQLGIMSGFGHGRNIGRVIRDH